MNERLLQFIWQFQYLNRVSLYTTAGEPMVIERPGTWNQHQGPDFSEAIIRIGNTRWVGNIELHVLSSDWHKHRHSGDRNYSNIILHVVWEDDCPVTDPSGHAFSTLVLQPLVSKMLLERYRQIMESLVTVSCRSFLPAMNELNWFSWKERLAAERLERKSAHILFQFQQSGCHWEEVCWWMLATNFGIRVNSTLFEMVAKSIPFQLFAKHRNQFHQIEALLLGQANLLAGKYKEAYPLLLQREYHFLKKKYKFPIIQKQPAFLRMRPATFPTVRLAQLAMIVHRNPHLFSLIKETKDSKLMQSVFMVTANDYWHYHYRFDEPAAYQPKQLGKQMAENILINTIGPLLFAYGLYTREETYKQRAVQWLYELSPEQNQLTRQWQLQGIPNRSALDSQALIELTNHYCQHKRCLDCAVGNRIMKNYVL